MSPRELIYAKLKEAREAYRAGFASEPQKIMATLRDYQLNALFATSEALERGERYFMVVSAVGTGKSRIAVALVFSMNGFLITPSIEIMRGMLVDLGVDCSNMSSAKVAKVALEFRITTPVRLANRLSKGDDPICDDPPKLLVVDEAHGHVESNTIAGALRAMLPGACLVGLTATPYRGSAAGSKELKELWGEPYTAMSMPRAIEKGMILSPQFRYHPLVDTSTLNVVNGEFDPSEVEDAYRDKEAEIAKLALGLSQEGLPTVVAVSSTNTAMRVVAEINRHGGNGAAVLQDTSGLERARLYVELGQNKVIIVQISCLAVGFNLPALAGLVDARPTQSAVLLVQTYGRIMRVDPQNEAKIPVVICTNANVINHGHLFVGTPAYRDVVDIHKKEPKRDDRQFLRRLVASTEANLSRATILKAKTLDGKEATALNLCAPIAENSPVFHEHLIVRTPANKILHAERLTGANIDWSSEEAQWKETPLPKVLEGLKTQKKRGGTEMTEKQYNFWHSCARYIGMNPDVDPETFDSRWVGVLSAARTLRWKIA